MNLPNQHAEKLIQMGDMSGRCCRGRELRKGDLKTGASQPTARELGVQIGRMQPGVQNAITDVNPEAFP